MNETTRRVGREGKASMSRPSLDLAALERASYSRDKDGNKMREEDRRLPTRYVEKSPMIDKTSRANAHPS